MWNADRRIRRCRSRLEATQGDHQRCNLGPQRKKSSAMGLCPCNSRPIASASMPSKRKTGCSRLPARILLALSYANCWPVPGTICFIKQQSCAASESAAVLYDGLSQGASPSLPMKRPDTANVASTRIPVRAKPMLATLGREPFERPGWTYEEKYDGDRILAYKEGQWIRLLSRNAKDRTARSPKILAVLRQLRPSTLLLDGEVVVFDKRNVNAFTKKRVLRACRLAAQRIPHATASRGAIDYVVRGSLSTQLALVNLGCIAVHIRGTRSASLHQRTGSRSISIPNPESSPTPPAPGSK